MPDATGALVGGLLRAILDFIQASEDRALQEQALMDAQEVIKRELDRRKFATDDRLLP
jgi:hypothetical protein